MLSIRFDTTSLPPGGQIHVVFGAAAVAPDGYVEPDPVATRRVAQAVSAVGQAGARRSATHAHPTAPAARLGATAAQYPIEPARRCAASAGYVWRPAARVAAPGRLFVGPAAARVGAAVRAVGSPAARAAAWAQASSAPACRLGVAPLAAFAPALRVQSSRTAQSAAGLRLLRGVYARAQAAARLLRGLRSPFQAGLRPPPGRWALPVDPPAPGGCYTPPAGSAVHVRFALRALSASGPVHVVYQCGDGVKRPVVVPTLRYYIVINSATLTRVSNGLRIPAHSLQIGIDADSAQWSWSAAVPLAKLGDLERDTPDTPVELEAVINGHAWRLLLASVRESERFGSGSLQIGGYGIAAALASPWAPAVSRDNATAAATAQQLALLALSGDGIPAGWGLDWQAPDWLVPAGAWVHSGAALEAVARIAEAAGAYVQPHPTAKTLRVLPRYPAAPWLWPAQVPDVVLPSAAVLERGSEHVTRAGYNAVYVLDQAGAVAARVYRSGTAGNIAAQMIVDPLVTHLDAARARGLAVIGNTGNQQRVTLETGILPASGLIHVGQLIDWQRPSVTQRGIVRGLSVSAAVPAGNGPIIVRQTIEVETHAG